jgi:hypothetical protein
VPVLEQLISSFCESRAPVAPIYFKWASRPLVGVRTLLGSHLFEPGARATRGSLLLGKGQGHLMPSVVAVVSRRERAFQVPRPRAYWAEWAGGRVRLPRPSGYHAVMMARVRLRGRRGRGGPRLPVSERFSCS